MYTQKFKDLNMHMGEFTQLSEFTQLGEVTQFSEFTQSEYKQMNLHN